MTSRITVRHVGEPTVDGMASSKTQEGFNSGYSSSIVDKESKQRYADKLKIINGSDPCELPKKEWEDNIEMWPAITYVHVCMYLILYPSPYTQDDMLNYKSLDSFKNFQNGWVREVLVKEINQKKVVIGKVKHILCWHNFDYQIYRRDWLLRACAYDSKWKGLCA